MWAYLGARSTAPELPDLPWALVPPHQRGSLKYQRACNWLQALEGDLDTAHLGFLHARNEEGGGHAVSYGVEDRMRDIAVSDTRPRIQPHATPAGIAIGARRVHDAASAYWRITQFLMPIYTSVPAIGEQRRAKAWVPMDDHHTWVWEPNWPTGEDLRRRAGKPGRTGAAERDAPRRALAARAGTARRRARQRLPHHRGRQRSSNFTGLEESPPVQDAAVQESMGRIVDRSREHLGTSDRMMACARSCWGRPRPPAGSTALNPCTPARPVRGCQMVLARDGGLAGGVVGGR